MGNRGGSQCVGSDTTVLTTVSGHILETPIKDVICKFNHLGGDRFEVNYDYDKVETKIKTINGSSVTPLYRYQGDETVPLFRIVAEGSQPSRVFTLVATELHPVMRNHNSVTFASLLSEGDSVLLIDGIGKVINVERFEPGTKTGITEVYGLALGSEDMREYSIPPAPNPMSEAKVRSETEESTGDEDLEQYLYLLVTQMRNWSTFGLPLKESIIFTSGFATGGLAVQHQLSEILSNGINLNYFV
jgi:hypothetical protein